MTADSIKKSKSLSVFKDSAVCLVVLTAATLAGYAFKAFHLADADIIMLYIIAVLVISIFTSKIQFCLISSVVGVVLFNYFFTYPEFSLSAHDAGYPVTFVTMFITAFIAGTLANKLKRNTLIAEQNAREKEEAALLAQNEQLRANMLRSISHDLRTPLTSISGNASTLLSGGDTLDESARQQIYTDIYSESMWLIGMVENLLYATRIEDGRMQLNISVEILDDIVQEAVRHTERTHSKRNIIVDMLDEIIPVMADANLIVQVIVNLMDNAVKYSDDNSDVTVTVCRENAYAVISVSDHGTGISDEEKEKVFDMFYTGGSRSSDSRRSLGLGLALCRSIITSHGGTISVSDNIPNGTVVSFTLPIGEVDLNEYLVLVVEDDKPIRNLITTTLKMNDYRFITAVRGREAVMLSASHKPDIIILDLGLPDIDGVEVIEHIRTWSDVPIIIVSARSEDRDKITALDKGADDYLTKPFSVDELLARLRVIQRRLMKSENISVTEFVNGRLRIDYVSGCVHLDDEELHLTPIEYKLLCLLAKNVGKVLTHKYIIQSVWGTPADNSEASLRVFMATLRKKLSDSSQALIQTHIGIGYRMMKL